MTENIAPELQISDNIFADCIAPSQPSPTSDQESSPQLSQQQQDKQQLKELNGLVMQVRRKVSECEEYQLQACDAISLDNKAMYSKFPQGFSRIDEVDEEEEQQQQQKLINNNDTIQSHVQPESKTEIQRFYESNSDEEVPNVHTYVSNINQNSMVNFNKNGFEEDFSQDMIVKQKQKRNGLEINQQEFDQQQQQLLLLKQQQQQMYAKQQQCIIKNLDTGEVYDLGLSGIESKLNYSYCSLELKATRDSSEYLNSNNNNVSSLNPNYPTDPNHQSWKSFWVKVKKNNMLMLDYCESGDLVKLKQLLLDQQEIPTQVNYKSIDDWTALHFAASYGHYLIVAFLLQCAADPFSQSSMLRTPLHSAVISGNLKCVQYLVEKGGQKLINMQDKDFNTVLHLSTENDQLSIVEYLLQNGAYHSIKNHKNLSPYQLCISQEMKNLFQDYKATDSSQDKCYERLSVGGLVKRNNRADHVAKLLLMTQNVQKQAEQKKIQLQQEKQKLLKEMSWRDFRFILKLGQGSFGEVYLVEREKKLFAMKIQNKQQVIQKNLQRYVQTEKKALTLFNHPFIIKLHYAFQNESYLFMVMEFAEGGDMGNYLNKRNKLPEEEARIYTAQIVLALEELHKQDIVFRDLKPDNVVLDHLGNAKLTDFGLSKEGIKENTYTKSFCGSVAYLAPEILTKRPHSRTVDWYLLGTFLYELLVGIPPYYDNKKEILYDNIKRGPLKIPKSMSQDAKDLIKQLLNRNPKERLGSKQDAEDIKQHVFFKDMNWDDLYKGKVKAPAFDVPRIDTKQTIQVNFDVKKTNKNDNRSQQFMQQAAGGAQAANTNNNNNASQPHNTEGVNRIDKWSYIN